MDIPIYLGLGLLASGYALNRGGKQARSKPKLDKKKKDAELENKKAGGRNVYEAGYFQKVREIEDDRVIANFEKSFDPINTNVIPHYFNTLNETQVKRVKNPKYDKNVFNKELSKIMKEIPIQLSKLEPTPNDLTDLNQDASLETGGTSGSPPKGLYAETELNKGWSHLVTRPTGNRGDGNRDVATHNNMVPFFGGSVRQNMDIDNRMMADKLETFTGQFKLDQNKKVEVTPLFAPVQQNLDQLVEPRELDRYVTSTQIRNNELPFEQIHVGRGLNDGYTARPSGGFHNPLRVLPKTIDELLVNPRVVKEGRVIRGKDPIDQRTSQMDQYKYRPELLVTNFNGERNFTTTGVQQKPMVRSKIIQKPTERRKSKQIIGIATEQGGSKNVPSSLQGKVKPSQKANFKNTPFRNAYAAEGTKAHNNQQLRFENRANERSTTQLRYGKEGYSFANCKADVERSQVYQLDPAKKTRNESYVHAANPTGYVNVVNQKGVVYDPSQVAKTTVRETTEDHNYVGHVKNDQGGVRVYDPSQVAKTTVRETTENLKYLGHIKNDQGGVQVYDPHAVAKTTVRETTEEQKYMGHVKNDQGGGRVYDPYETAKVTHRETTEEQKYIGHIKNDQGGVQVYDPSQVARTTVRETTEEQKYLGQVKNDQGMGVVYDPHAVAKTTVRETTEDQKYLGIIGMSQQNKSVVYDPFDVAVTTHRETTEQNDYLMPVQATHLQNGTGYQTAPTDTKNTQRQFYSDNYHVGGAGQADAPSSQQLYDAAYNMHQSNSKEVVAEGRQPTLSGMKLNAGKETINMEIKKLESDRVNQYSVMRAPLNCNQRLPQSQCQLTSVKNSLPEANSYFDPTVLKTHMKCPLTQSLHSWA